MNNFIGNSSEAFFVIAFCSVDPSLFVSILGAIFLLLSCIKAVLDIKYHPKNQTTNGKGNASPDDSSGPEIV